MGLIEFLEGAYKGGRLLFLLYDHDKQVKLRYKAIKGSGIKRLPNLSSDIASERIKLAEKRDLVKQQRSYLTRDRIEDEIKSSLDQGFGVTVRDNYISVWCFKTGSTEVMFITDHTSEGTKLSMINKMKHRLIERRYYINRPLLSESELKQRNMELDMQRVGFY